MLLMIQLKGSRYANAIAYNCAHRRICKLWRCRGGCGPWKNHGDIMNVHVIQPEIAPTATIGLLTKVGVQISPECFLEDEGFSDHYTLGILGGPCLSCF